MFNLQNLVPRLREDERVEKLFRYRNMSACRPSAIAYCVGRHPQPPIKGQKTWTHRRAFE
jgi:hypothetical protein